MSPLEERINQIHELIKETFPDAVAVKVFVNAQGIEVNPEYRTNLAYFSMQTITGNWVKRRAK